MAVQLEIRDGDPWWLSPDIWVVPGFDPLGPPALPAAGMNAFVWARVHNLGDTQATNAEVRFYWADPSTAFDRNTAHYIGSSFVTLAPGSEADVLCLSPWVPEYVNNGHECLLAEAFQIVSDPLPTSPAFNVPTDRHVAQRNLTVGAAAATGFFTFPLTQFNTSRLPATFQLVAEPAPLALLKPLLPKLGLDLDLTADAGTIETLGFSDSRCPHEEELKTHTQNKIEIDLPGQAKGVKTLIGRLEGGPALIHIKQFHRKRVIGGQSVLVLPDTTGPAPKRNKARARKVKA